VYVAALPLVDGGKGWGGPESVNGQTYTSNVVRDCGSGSNPSFRFGTFDIGRAWTTFSATVGWADDLGFTAAQATFVVQVDGQTVYESPPVGLGQTVSISGVNVSGALRLTLGVNCPAYRRSPSGPTLSYDGDAVFGDARLER
jgi:hypothetical protein